MPRKTYKLRKNRRKTAKRGGLFGFSTHANKESGENVKNIYKLEIASLDGAQVLKIMQKKAKLGNIWGIKNKEDAFTTHIGNLFVGSIFYAKDDRSITARVLGSNKHNAHEDNNRTKQTRLSRIYNASGLKSLASAARSVISLGNTFSTGRWPETGFYIVTSINSNTSSSYGWFSCSRLEYIVSSNSKNIKTIHDLIKINDENGDKLDAENKKILDSIKKTFKDNNNKCSFTDKHNCDIGLNNTSLTINNSNENFLDNIGFIIPTNEDNTNMKLFDFIKDFTSAPVSQPQLSIFGENGGKSKKQILYILLAMKLKANVITSDEFFEKIEEIEAGAGAGAGE